MTSSTQTVTAGLVFLGNRTFDMAAIACRVADTLARLGERVNERRILTDDLVVIRCGAFDCRLQAEGPCHVARIDGTAARRLGVTLMREAGLPPPDIRHMEATIAHVLADLQAVLAPDYVQWTDPDAVLTRAEFRLAVAGTAALPVPARIAPKVRQRRKRLPDVETVYAGMRQAMPGDAASGEDPTRLDALRAAFRDPEPDTARVTEQHDSLREQTAPMRLAVWMMTITLGIFALPVAAALAVINLLRGENLRLTSQAAALSGTFMVLSASGQIAQAAEIMQTMLP